MTEKLTKFFFFLLILLIPIQLGKHFWPSFSFVSGIRVDYLSPTLHLSDIAVFFVIIFFVLTKKSFHFKFDRKLLPYVSLFVLVLLIQLFTSKSPLAHLYGIAKLIEFFIIGLFVAIRIQHRDLGIIVRCFGIGAFFSSLLGMAQLFLQHSVGGLFYFLGERTFAVTTIGIAKMNSYDMQILRPYGAFSHPNVLAFFLLMVIVFTIPHILYEKNKTWNIFLRISVVISSASLLLTFSRVTILCFIGFLLYYFVFKLKKKHAKQFIFYAVVACFILFFLALFYKRFFIFGSDFFYRFNLLSITLLIIQKNFLFGVGLNNFFVHEIFFQKIISPILLQPVHNIYLLVFAQVGLLGSLLPSIFMLKTGRQVFRSYTKEKHPQIKSMYESLVILLVAALSVGFFDHFFLTVQQGQLMFALLLGFCWANFKFRTIKA